MTNEWKKRRWRRINTYESIKCIASCDANFFADIDYLFKLIDCLYIHQISQKTTVQNIFTVNIDPVLYYNGAYSVVKGLKRILKVIFIKLKSFEPSPNRHNWLHAILTFVNELFLHFIFYFRYVFNCLILLYIGISLIQILFIWCTKHKHNFFFFFNSCWIDMQKPLIWPTVIPIGTCICLQVILLFITFFLTSVPITVPESQYKRAK